MKGRWNLSDRSFDSVRVSVLQLLPECNDASEEADKLRLLVLSHSIAFSHIPAFFLESIPKYFPLEKKDGACVIVFDLEDSFSTYQIPLFIKRNDWIWKTNEVFNKRIASDLQRCLTLRSYYEYSSYKPLYFTSHIIITDFPLQSNPFILMHTPIQRNGRIAFRTIIQGYTEMIFDFPFAPKPNTYILIPPYEHSFKVVVSDNQKCVVKYVDLSEKTIFWRKTKFVYLKAPNVGISKYFTVCPVSASHAEMIAAKHEARNRFGSKNFLDVSDEEIDDFFTSHFTQNGLPAAKVEDDEIVFEKQTPADIVSEMIGDDSEKRAILRTFKTNGIFPSKPMKLTLLVANFLSSFRFDFGFNTSYPPHGTGDFSDSCEFSYEHLGIPNVLVFKDTRVVDVPATELIVNWQNNMYRPISGPKNASFVVFYEDQFDEAEIKTFFRQFCNQYTACNFGELTKYPMEHALFPAPAREMQTTVMKFFKNNQVSQYQVEPLMTFIVGDPIFSAEFMPHSVVTYVRPEAIREATTLAIKTLAFVVYSRVRVFSPKPFGMVFLAAQDIATCFFGFRYQPPFLLGNQSDDFVMHICWDQKAKLSTWVDDTGAVMHVLPVSGIEKLFVFIRELVGLFSNVNVKVTVSVLAEGIKPDVLNEINQSIAATNCQVTVFSLFPSSSIQCVFDEQFVDDVIVFDECERSFKNSALFQQPFESCYVLSRTLQPYSVSLYSASSNPRKTLFDFVQRMSHLSWLSVKPCMEHRTVSYPPHMMALLRKGNGPISQLSILEYLPSLEKI